MKKITAFIFILCVLFTFQSIAKPLPVEYFSRLPAFQKVELSPSGNKIAYLQNTMLEGGMSILTVFDITTRKSKLLIKSGNQNVKINWYEWANDNILLVSARYTTTERRAKYYQTRLVKLDLREERPKPESLLRESVGSMFDDNTHTSQFQDSVVDFLPDDPEHILMQIDYDTLQMPSVYKINVENRDRTRVERGKKNIRDWTVDQQKVVRIGWARDWESSEAIYWHRFNEDDEFEVLFNYDLYKDTPITVLGFDLDPNILYYLAYDGDHQALYRMNLKTKATEQLLKHKDYDVDGSLIYSKVTKRVIGIYDAHSKFGRFYFDNEDYTLLSNLKETFKNAHVIITTSNHDESRYVALVHADNLAPVYYLGDRKTNQLAVIASQYPELNNQPLPEHEKLVYKARDGVEIEAYLTLPIIGKAPYPTVIHPHGGPGARDYSGFDPWVSYMTNKGYAVVRPNFRGSTGYGFEFAKAQMGRWGLEMQDDLTDAAKWLVKEGIADPDKMCIFGASYGGYAANMATVKTPDLFACAVSFAGISDLRELVRNTKRFSGGELIAENQFGEDKDDLEARSPINHVEKIKTPILLMHGDQDVSVRVKQSRNFAEELEDENKVFKYVEFEDGDHYLSQQKNRKRFFAELDAFFTQYLGEPEVNSAP